MSETTIVSVNLASTIGASANGANIATTIGETTSGAIFAGSAVALGDGRRPSLVISSLRRLSLSVADLQHDGTVRAHLDIQGEQPSHPAPARTFL
jgi:hypothetical protein